MSNLEDDIFLEVHEPGPVARDIFKFQKKQALLNAHEESWKRFKLDEDRFSWWDVMVTCLEEQGWRYIQ